MRTLLHVCCGPCATWPHAELTARGDEVGGFFYNPNIHPWREYLKREEGVREFSRASGCPIVFAGSYDPGVFFQAVGYPPDNRCRACYRLRLSAAAEEARKGGWEAFTTTLLLSIHQNRRLVVEAGDEAGRRAGVEFLDHDFRPGWREHWKMTGEMGLYKQQYCGCLYSEYERFRDSPPPARESR